MTWLVGDIGGTNSRFARAGAAGLRPDSLVRLGNDGFGDFAQVLGQALGGGAAPQGICLAVAGPVQAGRARLTNRPWTINAAEIEAATGAARVVILNDLSALGHAAARLPAGRFPSLAPDAASLTGSSAQSDAAPQGQGLVIGIGTGLNVCPFRREADSVAVLEAEAGHIGLPAPVLAAHQAAWGGAVAPASAPTCEEALAGDALARLAAARGCAPPGGAAAVVAAALAGDGLALRVVTDFATVMGALAASFALAYLPRAGLWMAGSVARGVLSVPEARAAFLAAFASPQPAVGRLDHQVPLRLIDEDMAALEGCRMLLADTQGPLAGAASPRG